MRCQNATAEVRLRTFLSPCVDDCGPYGQCKLLRTHNYLYAACECKAGEQSPEGVGEGTRKGQHSLLFVGLLAAKSRLVLFILFPPGSSHPTGWRGWGCTDSEDAPTYGFQLLSTLLLCLSNLMFLPPVVLAIRSRYVLEAAVYTFTMFFSTVRGGPCLV